MSSRALAPVRWQVCARLTPEEVAIVEEYFRLLLRGELKSFRLEWRGKDRYECTSFAAAARSELEAQQYAATLGPGWKVQPANHSPGEFGSFRPVGIRPAIDLYGPDGERWEGKILPQRDDCPTCGGELVWIYTGQPVDVEYGECWRCAPRTQAAWRRLPAPPAARDWIQGDLFAGVA